MKEMHNNQKEFAYHGNDEYSKGFYDGLEIIISLLEERDPKLTEVNPKGWLM